MINFCHSEYSKISSSDWNAGMEMSVPLVIGIISIYPICPNLAHTSIRHCLRSFICCTFAGKPVAELCLRFYLSTGLRLWLFDGMVNVRCCWLHSALVLGISSETSDQYCGVGYAIQKAERDMSLSISCVLTSGLVAAIFSSMCVCCVHFGLL